MEDAHAWAGAVGVDDRRDAGLFDPAGVPAQVRDGVRVDGAGVLEVDPVVRGAEALLAEHAGRHEDASAAATAPPHETAVLQLRQVAADGYARIPGVAQAGSRLHEEDASLPEVTVPQGRARQLSVSGHVSPLSARPPP